MYDNHGTAKFDELMILNLSATLASASRWKGCFKYCIDGRNEGVKRSQQRKDLKYKWNACAIAPKLNREPKTRLREYQVNKGCKQIAEQARANIVQQLYNIFFHFGLQELFALCIDKAVA